MTENQRESFRIGPEADLEAELFHEGRVAPCRLENLSAGGAKVQSSLRMTEGTQCTLGVRLGASLRSSSPIPYVSFLMEVLDVTGGEGDERLTYRLRSTTGPGSAEYDEAAKLVFAAQRKARGRVTGADEASPMVSEPERREKLREQRRPRYTKRSLRPGSGE